MPSSEAPSISLYGKLNWNYHPHNGSINVLPSDIHGDQTLDVIFEQKYIQKALLMTGHFIELLIDESYE